MPKKKGSQPHPTNIVDYPSAMSTYERDSLAAEAKLATEKKINKPPKSAVKSK